MIRYFALSLMLTTNSAQAETGNELYSKLVQRQRILEGKQGNAHDAGYADGYISATGLFTESLGRTCAPEGATRGQATDIIFKYLASNPAKRHEEAGVLIVNALKDAFPCKK